MGKKVKMPIERRKLHRRKIFSVFVASIARRMEVVVAAAPGRGPW